MSDRNSLEITLEQFATAHRDGGYLLDVREPGEYESGHVPGARLVPLGRLGPDRSLPRQRPVYVICASGSRSRRAAATLRDAGYEALSVAGGTSAWAESGRPVVTGTAAR